MTAQRELDWFDPDVTTFGDRLTGAREAAGMNQEDLAHRLGVKLKTLQSWENDLSEPRANRLSMLAGLLNVSLPWLLSGESDHGDTPTARMPEQSNLVDVLAELRDLQAQIASASDRMNRLERTLRSTLTEEFGA
ncbi:MAG: helix-turn-helix transcriptional regulator [Pseudomonadota bacterium]